MGIAMSTWKINLENQTPTSINGITFKLTETKRGEYEDVCPNPKDIPPDDLDDEILGRMIKEAGVFYRMELERLNSSQKRNNFSFSLEKLGLCCYLSWPSKSPGGKFIK